jgi:threonine/homoserine/homoserine lactone efflux protein
MLLVLHLGTALAAFVSILTPGPGMLALCMTVAVGGRRQGLRFVAGEIAGDVLWSTLALAAILGVSSIGPQVFSALGVCCGLYLVWMGWRALTARVDDAGQPVRSTSSLRTGLILGVTNPKSYPVYVALFGAALGHFGQDLTWSLLPLLVLSAVAGFIAADALLLLVAGLPLIRTRLLRHRRLVQRGVGLAFLAFGGKLAWDGVCDLAPAR